MSDIKDKREPEIKVPGLEERLAYILAHKGAHIFNKETETAGEKTIKSCLAVLLFILTLPRLII